MKTSSKTNKKIALYESISTILLFNWEKVSTGDISYLIVNERDRNKSVPDYRLQNAYDTICDEYFAAMDIDPTDDELIILIQKIIWKRQEYLDGDRSAMNFIRAYEEQIKSIKQRETKNDFVKNRMAVTKWYGQKIDPKDTTLEEFIKIIDLMKESAPKTTDNGESSDT